MADDKKYEEEFKDVVIAFDADAFKAECWALYGFPDELPVDTYCATRFHNGTGINLRYAKLPNGKRALFYTCDGNKQNWDDVDDFIEKFCPAGVIKGGRLHGFNDFPFMLRRRLPFSKMPGDVRPYYEQWRLPKMDVTSKSESTETESETGGESVSEDVVANTVGNDDQAPVEERKTPPLKLKIVKNIVKK